ncbi:hypothetical protein K469DRAFT_726326 [Zopfia rhizophila CBS 207.26]|uniref:DUF7924 domain-containing protein n=1 Tax=Zopfia rhizophila CBS 207.26 TaxID=1314779 RepID=A0A6A6E553_9PEZI|nr:hypothetical protein K469DRAFT_726326 [Zopfia rhizophila CBS 207.26]
MATFYTYFLFLTCEAKFPYDHRSVRIYGHYAVIDGTKTTLYRRPIHKFISQILDGKGKWTAYQFTKNVYEGWMPTHFKRICSLTDTFKNSVMELLRTVPALKLTALRVVL